MSNPSPLAVISSDWHLELRPWARHPDLIGDSYFSLEQIISYCVRYRLPMIAAGDLFDTISTDSLSLERAFASLDKLAEHNIPILFTQGQHEFCNPPWLSLHPHSTHLHQTQIRIDPFNFYGLDYTRPSNLQEAFSNIPSNTDILISHQIWSELVGGIFKPECSLSDVPHVSMVFSGDYHKCIHREGVGKSNQSIVIYSPGSTSVQAINEPAQKYFLVLYSDATVKTIPLKTRPVYHQNIYEGNDWDQWEAHILSNCPPDPSLKEIGKPILEVKYPRTLANAYKEIHTRLQGQYHLFLSPQQLAIPEPMAHVEERKALLHKGLLGCLPQFFKEESLSYQLTERLLLSQDPRSELHAIFLELTAEEPLHEDSLGGIQELLPVSES